MGHQIHTNPMDFQSGHYNELFSDLRLTIGLRLSASIFAMALSAYEGKVYTVTSSQTQPSALNLLNLPGPPIPQTQAQTHTAITADSCESICRYLKGNGSSLNNPNESTDLNLNIKQFSACRKDTVVRIPIKDLRCAFLNPKPIVNGAGTESNLVDFSKRFPQIELLDDSDNTIYNVRSFRMPTNLNQESSSSDFGSYSHTASGVKIPQLQRYLEYIAGGTYKGSTEYFKDDNWLQNQGLATQHTDMAFGVPKTTDTVSVTNTNSTNDSQSDSRLSSRTAGFMFFTPRGTFPVANMFTGLWLRMMNEPEYLTAVSEMLECFKMDLEKRVNSVGINGTGSMNLYLHGHSYGSGEALVWYALFDKTQSFEEMLETHGLMNLAHTNPNFIQNKNQNSIISIFSSFRDFLEQHQIVPIVIGTGALGVRYDIQVKGLFDPNPTQLSVDPMDFWLKYAAFNDQNHRSKHIYLITKENEFLPSDASDPLGQQVNALRNAANLQTVNLMNNYLKQNGMPNKDDIFGANLSLNHNGLTQGPTSTASKTTYSFGGAELLLDTCFHGDIFLDREETLKGSTVTSLGTEVTTTTNLGQVREESLNSVLPVRVLFENLNGTMGPVLRKGVWKKRSLTSLDYSKNLAKNMKVYLQHFLNNLHLNGNINIGGFDASNFFQYQDYLIDNLDVDNKYTNVYVSWHYPPALVWHYSPALVVMHTLFSASHFLTSNGTQKSSITGSWFDWVHDYSRSYRPTFTKLEMPNQLSQNQIQSHSQTHTGQNQIQSHSQPHTGQSTMIISNPNPSYSSYTPISIPQAQYTVFPVNNGNHVDYPLTNPYPLLSNSLENNNSYARQPHPISYPSNSTLKLPSMPQPTLGPSRYSVANPTPNHYQQCPIPNGNIPLLNNFGQQQRKNNHYTNFIQIRQSPGSLNPITNNSSFGLGLPNGNQFRAGPRRYAQGYPRAM